MTCKAMSTSEAGADRGHSKVQDQGLEPVMSDAMSVLAITVREAKLMIRQVSRALSSFVK